MRVWIVFYFEDCVENILGVFSSIYLAEKAKSDDIHRTGRWGDDYSIGEYELDPLYPETT